MTLDPYQRQSAVPDLYLKEAYNKKLTAGICGILIGSLGIHKFVLGYTTAGVIMLLISIVGGILTCGVAASVVGVVGLVEGIIYLTKSDQQFFNEYIAHKKEWF